MAKTASGALLPSEGASLVSMLGGYIKALESSQIEVRLAALEAARAKDKREAGNVDNTELLMAAE
jgi:hypothetical protein